MTLELKEVRLDALSDVRYSFWTGTHQGTSYTRDVLVIRFEGNFGFGSGGNSDASFMVAMGNAGVEAFEPEAIIIDLSALSYEWGDMMESVFGIGNKQMPTALVVGEKCREAIGTLCFGVDSTQDACETEWIFDSLDGAWHYVTGLLNDGESPPIHQAAANDDLQRVTQLLEAGESPNRLDSSGYSPLHVAASTRIVKLLIQAGADPRAKSSHGITPLHLVKEVDSARLLLEAGADPDARSWTGLSPLGHVRTVDLVRLLIQAGADVHQRQRSSLLHSVRHPEIAKVLIEAGAIVNLLDEHGRTPLDKAEEDHQIFHRQAQVYNLPGDAQAASHYAEIVAILRANGGKSGGEIKANRES